MVLWVTEALFHIFKTFFFSLCLSLNGFYCSVFKLYALCFWGWVSSAVITNHLFFSFLILCFSVLEVPFGSFYISIYLFTTIIFSCKFWWIFIEAILKCCLLIPLFLSFLGLILSTGLSSGYDSHFSCYLERLVIFNYTKDIVKVILLSVQILLPSFKECWSLL